MSKMNEMNASVERLQNSKVVPDFTWWHGSVFLEIAEKVEKAGPDAIVKMRQGLKENGFPEVWFVVESEVSAAGEGDGGTNDSHTCPPLPCP